MGEFSRIYRHDISDRQFAAFWQGVLASGRARTVGHDMPPMDAAGFCRWMRRDGVYPWIVAFRGEPVGFYYLTDVQGRSARIHFLTLPCGTRRTAGRRPLAKAAALYGMGMALWDEEGYRLDTLIGFTPASNRPAVRFVRSLGGHDHGEVPGLCWLHDEGRSVPAVITVFDRETVPAWTAQL